MSISKVWLLALIFVGLGVVRVIPTSENSLETNRVQVVETRLVRTIRLPFIVPDDAEPNIGWIAYEPRGASEPDWPDCGETQHQGSCILNQYVFEVRYLDNGELWGFLTTELIHDGGYIEIPDRAYKIDD